MDSTITTAWYAPWGVTLATSAHTTEARANKWLHVAGSRAVQSSGPRGREPEIFGHHPQRLLHLGELGCELEPHRHRSCSVSSTGYLSMCTWRKFVELNTYDLFTFPYMYDISVKSSKTVLLSLLSSFLLLLHSIYHHITNYVLCCFVSTIGI